MIHNKKNDKATVTVVVAMIEKQQRESNSNG
jgi:hypothetical protein